MGKNNKAIYEYVLQNFHGHINQKKYNWHMKMNGNSLATINALYGMKYNT